MESVEHLSRLIGVSPLLIAHDLHPDYLSTRYAMDLAEAGEGELELVGVQHHHAHIASCLVDNQMPGPVIGVAFDGTGYGTDGDVVGRRVSLADLAGARRAGHLAPVPMPGAEMAVRQPWRMAAAYCAQVGVRPQRPTGTRVTGKPSAPWPDRGCRRRPPQRRAAFRRRCVPGWCA